MPEHRLQYEQAHILGEINEIMNSGLLAFELIGNDTIVLYTHLPDKLSHSRPKFVVKGK